MDLDQLIDELEAVVERGERFWHLLGGRAMVKADKLYDLAQRLRASIPEEVRENQAVRRSRDDIIREAHEEYAKIIQAAREQSELLTNSDQLVIEAKRRRDEILERAKIEAEGIRDDAYQYARNVIEKLSENLLRIQAAVNNTKEMLQREQETSAQESDTT
ncbi:MAG: hypothetical protein ACUVX8_13675 [Candidatus Zipacnadales bacterium]